MAPSPVADVRAARGGPPRARALTDELATWSSGRVLALCESHLESRMPNVVLLAILADLRLVGDRHEHPSAAALEFARRRGLRRYCRVCRSWFRPTKHNQRWCSPRCAKTAALRRYRGPASFPRRGRCEGCGARIWRRVATQRFCSHRCKERIGQRARRARVVA